MSKSTGHFKTMEEISRRFAADVVRFYLLSTHYRSEIEFSDERLSEAGVAIERFENLFRVLVRSVGPEGEGETADTPSPAVSALRDQFLGAMDDDLNTAQAIGYLFELVRTINSEMESGAEDSILRADRGVLRELSDILGLLQHTGAADESVPDEIVRMVQERSDARDAKNWSLADELRAAIEEAGYVVEDTGTGSVARKAK